MSKTIEQLSPQLKIRSFAEIQPLLDIHRAQGACIVQCHGVFDLIHPGHIRHFREAKAQGDLLVVTLTPDRFVNKGPGRPAFNEALRLETLAALLDIDYVILNDSPDAISAIRKIRPAVYVKGVEYQNHADDVTGKIAEEARAVEESGGIIHYTSDIIFSSSSLLNRYFDAIPPKVAEFLSLLKQDHSADDILKKIHGLSNLKVLIIGDAIIDEYQYVDPLGQSGKGLHMVARSLEKDTFLGGSLIIANHVAQFAGEVTLLTALGKECPHRNFINQQLASNVTPEFVYLEETTTLIKKRYVLKDGKTLTKLFETYSGQEECLNQEQTNRFVQFLNRHASEYDVVIACDFGNGFTNHPLIDAISSVPTFLALNTQTNSGNRGYNVVTNYQRADYISLNEPELRLSAHDKTSSAEGIAVDIAEIMNCKTVSVTRGVNGVLCYSEPNTFVHIPAFATNSVDRIGAGDSYLSLSSLCLAKGYGSIVAGFIGSIAAAMSIQMVGNQAPIHKVALCKYITRLMK
ncbi:MAG TPA: PfkB family carbohydrate kinase [Chlamydiales bacterium]|jgi:cytidyltransferase-like protein